ncbi:hypothetical protein DNU06_08055 [Putridiphycobacter roseus]|uniref:Cyclic nucleotide-binding domain-containing protein n=1 Tax=Putridiphycobacter roseus TaxID=2219161 RepID=A0A2W1MZ83_9FLAO|nr:cyclic nucleotide-binding domain-containing protein [Putridiphycobacter roseus]PZE17217.1 hypothetical protein DNU06_08055 [Putridiphycobacter roseus]
MQTIIDYFNHILPISESEITILKPLLQQKVLEKEEFLLQENQVCKFIAFIKKGSFRSFHYNANGTSTNLMLDSSQTLISNYESYISQQPSNVSIQATIKSEVIYISKNDLDHLLENSFYWNKLGRILTENIFILSKQRLESIIYKTPEERYQTLIKYTPDLLEQFSLTDIASFIGVTPQSLSRIRARIH